MAIVAPFRGWRYDPARTGAGLLHVTAPPYDVIGRSFQDELYKMNPYNVVRVDLGKSRGVRHRHRQPIHPRRRSALRMEEYGRTRARPATRRHGHPRILRGSRRAGPRPPRLSGGAQVERLLRAHRVPPRSHFVRSQERPLPAHVRDADEPQPRLPALFAPRRCRDAHLGPPRRRHSS